MEIYYNSVLLHERSVGISCSGGILVTDWILIKSGFIPCSLNSGRANSHCRISRWNQKSRILCRTFTKFRWCSSLFFLKLWYTLQYMQINLISWFPLFAGKLLTESPFHPEGYRWKVVREYWYLNTVLNFRAHLIEKIHLNNQWHCFFQNLPVSNEFFRRLEVETTGVEVSSSGLLNNPLKCVYFHQLSSLLQ